MSDGSKIEWTDATWNVAIGCDKVSPGCDHCYAIRTAHRFQEHPNAKVSAAYAGTAVDGDWTGRVNLVEDRLDLPLRWTRPRRIFVNAQSDLFHSEVSDEFIARVFAIMACAPRHSFQILTKRHGRMRSLLSSPNFQRYVYRAINNLPSWDRVDIPGTLPLPNVWLGVSVEDQQRADLRIPALLDTPAAVRWISAEPLLGPVDLRLDASMGNADPGLQWVVVGGESGPGSRPMDPEWARSLRDQCVDAGVPFLFKQWGDHLYRGDLDNGTFVRVGKGRAGRILGDRTWDEYPAERSAR